MDMAENANAGAAGQAKTGMAEKSKNPSPAVSSEEKTPTSQFLKNIERQIFSDARESIEESLESAENLPTEIGRITTEVMASQIGAMKSVGKQMPTEDMMGAASEVVEHLTEFAEAMGLVDDAGDLFTQSLLNASQMFASKYPQHLDPEAVMQVANDGLSGKLDAEVPNEPVA